VSGVPLSDSDLEAMLDLPSPAEVPRPHDWRQPSELDAMYCHTCGLKVSMTRFPEVRDTVCGDWPDAPIDKGMLR